MFCFAKTNTNSCFLQNKAIYNVEVLFSFVLLLPIRFVSKCLLQFVFSIKLNTSQLIPPVTGGISCDVLVPSPPSSTIRFASSLALQVVFQKFL